MTRDAVAVALLSQTPERGAHLREVLLSLGAPVVYETSTHDLDRVALERSHANVVVVNLDSQGDPQLDDLTGLLTDTRYRVVFNDAEVSSTLSGWDQARWARHLAAKVLGQADIDPPRPADAQAVPSPWRDAIPDAEPQAAYAEADAFPVHEVAPQGDASPTTDERIELALDDEVFAVEAGETAADEDIEALLLEPFDLTDFGDSAATGEVAAEPVMPSLERPGEDTHADVDALDFDAATLGDFDVQEFAIDQTLVAAFDEDPPPAPPAADAAPAAPAVPSHWSLEDVLEPEAAGEAAPFGIETLTAEEYLAPSGAEESTPAAATPQGGHLLELIPMEEAVAPAAVESEPHEAWLDPDAVVVPAKVRRVWVLGASIGGPESVREFLAGLPRDYPALFLLAQHLGHEFVDLMARQLAKATALTVRLPTHGERIGHGEIAVVPATHRLQVDPEGIVVLERDTARGEYSPSIDRVLRDVADRFGPAAGAIIFSGMSEDAIEGSRYLAEKGGRVYAQDPDTCVVSAMVDGVRETGVVGFVGSPRELAEQLLAEWKQGI
jgi:two-component system chemotaxis response regulator CheB/chemosensory pili system protein ChpB (putative protein-glutamate methylesterase)